MKEFRDAELLKLKCNQLGIPDWKQWYQRESRAAINYHDFNAEQEVLIAHKERFDSLDGCYNGALRECIPIIEDLIRERDEYRDAVIGAIDHVDVSVHACKRLALRGQRGLAENISHGNDWMKKWKGLK